MLTAAGTRTVKKKRKAVSAVILTLDVIATAESGITWNLGRGEKRTAIVGQEGSRDDCRKVVESRDFSPALGRSI